MDVPWHIELFGGLQIVQEGKVHFRFQTAKIGVLLAYLTCSRPRPVSRELLADMLWPDAPVSASRNSLRVALNSLRRQLEPPGVPPGAILIADRVTVQLNPEAYVADIHEFEAQLQKEQRATTDADRIAALTTLIQIYKGELLQGLSEAWIHPERTRYADDCLAALKRLIRFTAQSKEYDKALEYARRAVEIDPLREGSHRDLMRLYVALGRPSAALTQYEELERMLREQIDALPSETTRELAKDIATQPDKTAGIEDALNAEAPPVRELRRVTDVPLLQRRQGDRNHSSNLMPGVIAPPTPPKVETKLTGSVPLQFTRFVGRAEEIATLAQQLLPSAPNSDRIITLIGLGGVGKTRLAIEIANLLRGAFADRVWFVPLSELSDADQVIQTIASVMRLPRLPDTDPLEQLVDALQGTPTLIVLDNMEHFVAQSYFDAHDNMVPLSGRDVLWLVRTLLQRLPLLRILATSRQRLDIEGEREMHLAPLPTPHGSDTPQHLVSYASVELFVDRAQAVRPDFQVTVGNAGAVADLCARLEGIPLAIELAAAWSPALSPAQMLEKLVSRFNLLISRRKDRTARHLSLRAALDYSYELLLPDQQEFFRKLAVFRGGWSLECVEEVFGQPNAMELLSQLQQRSLTQTEEVGAIMRFSLLETVREFAWERMSADERTVMETAHAAYFLQIADEAKPNLVRRDSELWFGYIELEQENLRAALGWFFAHSEIEALVRMSGALWRYWYARGHHAEGLRWLERALAAESDTNPHDRLDALEGAGRFLTSIGDTLNAFSRFQEQLLLARQLDEPLAIEASIANLCLVCRDVGDRDVACEYYLERLAHKRLYGNRWSIACALSDAAAVILTNGAVVQAEEFYMESLVLRRALGDLWGAGDTLLSLAHVADQRQKNNSVALCAEGASLLDALSEEYGIGATYLNLGLMAFEQGDYPAASALFQDALLLFRERGDNWYIALTLDNLADVAYRQNDLAQAQEYNAQCLHHRQEIADTDGIAYCLQRSVTLQIPSL